MTSDDESLVWNDMKQDKRRQATGIMFVLLLLHFTTRKCNHRNLRSRWALRRKISDFPPNPTTQRSNSLAFHVLRSKL